MSLLGCLAITEGYIVAYLAPPIYRRKVTLSKIVLMDGETIAQLMIDYGVGVNTVATYELKRIDSDYFSGE